MFSHVFSCFLMFSHVSLSSQHVSWICKLQVTCQSVCVGRCRNRDLLGGHTRTQRRTLVSDGFFMPPGQMLAGWLWVWTSRGRSWKSPGFNRQRHAEKRDEKSFRIEKNWEDGSWWVPFASRHLSKESNMWNPLKLCNVQQLPHWFNNKISPEDTALPHRWHRPVNQYLQSPMLTPDNLHISPHWQTLDCNDTSHNMFDLICNFKIHNYAALIQLTILRAHRAQCDFDIQSIFKAIAMRTALGHPCQRKVHSTDQQWVGLPLPHLEKQGQRSRSITK